MKRGAQAKTTIARRAPAKLLVSSQLVDDTAWCLQQFRSRRGLHEGIVYWAGVPNEQVWIVTTVIIPDARTSAGSFHVSARANADVIGFIADNHIQLLGQVHSHPGIYVGHSGGDIDGALMPYEGFISIVVPNYAEDGLLPFSKLGVHRFEAGAFTRLSEEEINHCLVRVSSVRDFRK